MEVLVLVPLFPTCTTLSQAEGDGREHQQIEL